MDPKRPSKSVNITPVCKSTPNHANTVYVEWDFKCRKGRKAVIGPVEQLLSRLNSKNKCQLEFTRVLIERKLTGNENYITTNLQENARDSE